MGRVRTHWFNGIRYDVDIDNARIDGLCDDPYDPTPSVRIYADLSTKAGFETALHEAMHASLWKLSEEDVTRAAGEITGFLWRLGFRLEQKRG
jgi:hypothetical protein